ncbi:MAG: NAD-dependent epimerase/dehydratase family protein [Firmicutes bacterium]|nr:NAD-dependent epimerase/dehydratase family protein [Bacillota bacterium]
MRILILGGTSFLGRHLVLAAKTRGHAVTLFNRGKTGPDLFPDVEQIRGDRDGGLSALEGRTWDVCIDTSGYLPRVVRQSVAALRQSVQHYVFVSSVSVYADFAVVGIAEEYPVARVEDESTEDIGQFYGALKALCENEVVSGFGPDHALIVRPGLIVGPYDPTDRFTYWVRRFAQGGRVVVPESPDRPIQLIDARDLAEWMLTLCENQVTGVFNATGLVPPLTMGRLVDALMNTLPAASEVEWLPEDFLLEHEVAEWSELPLWISDAANWPGFETVSVDRALAQGLTFRTIEDTIGATWEWDLTRNQAAPMKAGLTPERERELLADWDNQHA